MCELLFVLAIDSGIDVQDVQKANGQGKGRLDTNIATNVIATNVVGQLRMVKKNSPRVSTSDLEG